MAEESVGVSASFDVSDFLKGLQTYIQGLQKALAAGDALSKQLTGVNSALTKLDQGIASSGEKASKAAGAFQKAAQALGTIASAGSGGEDLSAELARELAYVGILKDDLRDLTKLRQSQIDLADRETTAVGRTNALLEQRRVGLLQQLRSLDVQELGFDTGELEEIRALQVQITDLNKKATTPLKDQVEAQQLLTTELQAQTQAIRLRNQMSDRGLSVAERRLATLKEQTIALQSAQRLERARALGVERAFLGTPQIAAQQESAQQQARAIRLLQQELKDTISLEQARKVQAASYTTEAERQKAVLEEQQILLERARRSQTAVELGVDEAEIQRIRQLQIDLVDPLRKQQAELNLINQAIQNAIKAQSSRNILASKYSTELERQLALQQQQNIALSQRQGERQAEQLGIDPAILDQYRNLNLSDPLADAAREAQFLREEINRIIRLEELSKVANNQLEASYNRQAATNERITIQLEQQLAKRRAAAEGLDVERLSRVAEAEAKDAGDPLREQKEVLELYNAELSDTARLERILNQLRAGGVSVLEEQRAKIEQASIAVRRQLRERQAGTMGIDVSQLEQYRRITGSVSEDLNRQIAIQSLLNQEISDTISLERNRLVLQNRQSTELQRQAAQVEINRISAARGLRDQDVRTYGASVQKMTDQIRNATVSHKDLANATKQTGVQFQAATEKSIALGAAVGVTVANALRGAINQMRIFARAIFDTVAFFERFNLTVEFFVARNAIAANETLSFNQALAQTQDEARGTVYWLQQIGVASPFTTKDVATLYRTAQAYGLTRKEAELFTPLLVDFASAAGLSEDVLERLALAIGQVRSRGKLTGEEVRQLGNAGLPIRDILVKNLGIANSEFDDLLERGTLTSNVVIPEIIKALKAFEGQGERISFQTLTGIVSAFKELGQIGIASFFRGLVPPVRDFFKELFDGVNESNFQQWLFIIGELVGNTLVKVFEFGRTKIQQFFQTLQNLDTAMVGQIATIAIYAALFGGMIATAGLLTAALNALLNPLVLIPVAMAAVAVTWKDAWSNLSAFTERTSDRIRSSLLGTFSSIAAGFSRMVDSIGEGVVNISEWFGSLASDAAAAFTGGLGTLNNALRGVGELFSWWLAPGSDPRAIPGFASWFAYLGKTGPLTFAESIQQNAWMPIAKVQQMVDDVWSTPIPRDRIEMQSFAAARMYATGFEEMTPVLFDNVGDVMAKQITSKLGKGSDVEGAAVDAAIDVSAAYINSFLGGLALPTIAPSEKMQEILAQIGGGPRLTRQGAIDFGRYLEGFTEADYGFLGELSGILTSQLQNLVDLGEVRETDLPSLIFGGRETIAKAIQEFRKVGVVTSETVAKLRDATQGLPADLGELLVAYAPYQVALDRVNALQEKLNDTTKRYKNLIEPIRKELEAISDARKVLSENAEIRQMQRIIENEAAGELRKQDARLRIQEIQKQRELRGLERSRDAAIDSIQGELELQQQQADKYKEILDLTKSRIDAQMQQLDLVAQEYQLFKQLQEELKKEQEKQLSLTERQAKLVQLQQSEISDLLRAAKARRTLESAESTELQKQQAILELQSIALARQERLKEATELGFKEEELTRFYGLQVLLSDIEKGGKDATEAFAEGLGELEGLLPDVLEFNDKWNEGLAQVRDRWIEIKTQISETATEINENLPEFLKFIPEGPGEEPPIIQFIKNYADAIKILAGVIITFKVIDNVNKTADALARIFGIGAAGAAGGIGGKTLSASIIALIGKLSLALSTLSVAALGAGTALLILYGSWRRLSDPNFDPTPQWKEFSDTLGNLDIVGPQGQMFSISAEIRGMTDAELERAAEGLIPGIDQLEALVERGRRQREEVLGTIPTEVIDAFTKAQGGPGNVSERINNVILSGFPNSKDVRDAVLPLGEAMDQGIMDGLKSDTGDRYGTSNEYIQKFLDETLGPDNLDAQSPSRLMADEVGRPMGQGIILGLIESISKGLGLGDRLRKSIASDDSGNILRSLYNSISEAASDMVNGALGSFKDLRVGSIKDSEKAASGVESEWDSLLQTVLESSETVSNVLVQLWEFITSNAQQSFDTMSTNIQLTLTTLYSTIIRELTSLKDEIIGILATDPDSLLVSIQNNLLGQNNSIPENIGISFVKGIALGLNDEETWNNFLVPAVQQFLDNLETQFQTEQESASPSMRAAREIGEPFAQGIMLGILRGGGAIASSIASVLYNGVQSSLNSAFSPSQTFAGSSIVNSVNRTNQFNLNVNSAVPSQGIINDFSTMRVMAAG